ELISVLNVTQVLKQWQHRVLFIVSRQATSYHGYLQRAFADVDWAEVIFDRRQGERRQQDSPWMVERPARGRRVPAAVPPVGVGDRPVNPTLGEPRPGPGEPLKGRRGQRAAVDRGRRGLEM